MSGFGWFMLIALSYVGISIFIAYMKRNKYNNLKNEIPIYWSEQLGRDFVVVGTVNSDDTKKIDAEISLMEQAKKLNADAIICTPIGTTTEVYSKKNYTVGSSNTFHYNGSAIKFKENLNPSNTNQTNYGLEQTTNNLEETITKLENDAIIEIEKQKKLLENEIISEEECKERIVLIKKQLADKKETIKNQMSEEVMKADISANIKIMMNSKFNDFIQAKINEGYSYDEKNKTLINYDDSSFLDYKIEQNENGDCQLISNQIANYNPKSRIDTKILIAIVIGIIFWYIAGSLTHSIARSANLTWFFGILFGVISGYITFKMLGNIFNKKNIKDADIVK